MDKRKIILDCDPGHDDAVAIILAGKSQKLDLLGITVVGGNQTIEKVSRNAFNICKYLDINVPISIGCSDPLIQKIKTCPRIHGESGLDGFTFPDYELKFDDRLAPNFIVDKCHENKHVTLVATGPMTNIAMALKLDPSIKENIDEIIFMGGSMVNGNVTPAAEFNIKTDPEAAYIVIHSGCKVKMVGLDVTRKVLANDEIIAKAMQKSTKSADLFVKLMRVFVDNQAKTFGLIGAPLHDPATIVALLDEDALTFTYMNVEIDISHGPSYGRTNCDIFDYLQQEKNCYVATDIDTKKYWDVVLSHLDY